MTNEDLVLTLLSELLDRIDHRRAGIELPANYAEKKRQIELTIMESRHEILQHDPSLVDLSFEAIMQRQREMQHTLDRLESEPIEELEAEDERLDQEIALLEQRYDQLLLWQESARALNGYVEKFLKLLQVEKLGSAVPQTSSRPETQSEMQARYDTLTAEIDELQEQIDFTREDMSPLITQRVKLMQEIARKLDIDFGFDTIDIAREQTKLAELRGQFQTRLEAIQSENDQVQARNSRLKNEIEALKTQLAQTELRHEQLQREDVRDHTRWLKQLREYGQTVSRSVDADDILHVLMESVFYERRKRGK